MTVLDFLAMTSLYRITILLNKRDFKLPKSSEHGVTYFIPLASQLFNCQLSSVGCILTPFVDDALITKTREANVQLWEGIYAEGAQLVYPDETLVRVTHRLLKPKQKILDYGFGAGANMMHLLRKGHEMSGCEVSESAVSSMNLRLAKMGAQAHLRLMDGPKIPFANESFDVVMPWLVLCYNTRETFAFAMSELNRVLRPGGTFLGTIAGHGDYAHTHSVPLGNDEYRSTVVGQEGAIRLIVPKKELYHLFPAKDLTIGFQSFEFGERHSKHWIVSYQKA